MEEVLSSLRRLGLNVYESKAYLALVSQGMATAGRLAERSGVPRAKVYEVLKGLENSGFVISAGNRPARFKALPIDSVIEKLREDTKLGHEKKLKEIESLKGDLKARLAKFESPVEDEAEGMVLVLKGRDSIYDSLGKLIDEAKSKIVWATTEKGLMRKVSKYGEKLAEAAQRGVEIRLLAPITRMNGAAVKENMGNIDFKHSYSVTNRFLLSDDQRGVIVLVPDGLQKRSEPALYVNSPYFISGLSHYFDHKWEKTTPAEERLKELGL